MCDLGFHNQIEGLLGEGTYLPELLIILREPHEKDSNENQIFWFKGEVIRKQSGQATTQKANSTGTRFYNIYSALAKKILETEDDSVLQRCAYMNLHPFCGGGSKGPEFRKVLKELKKMSEEECDENIVDSAKSRDPKVIAKHRMHIIQRAIDNGVKNIITTEDIYSAISNKWGGCDEKSFVLQYKDKGVINDKKFHVCWLGKNKETRLISFRHPSCTSIDYGYMDKIQIP